MENQNIKKTEETIIFEKEKKQIFPECNSSLTLVEVGEGYFIFEVAKNQSGIVTTKTVTFRDNTTVEFMDRYYILRIHGKKVIMRPKY